MQGGMEDRTTIRALASIKICTSTCKFMQGGMKDRTTRIIVLICNIWYVGEDYGYELLSAACGTYIIALSVFIILEYMICILM